MTRAPKGMGLEGNATLPAICLLDLGDMVNSQLHEATPRQTGIDLEGWEGKTKEVENLN